MIVMSKKKISFDQIKGRFSTKEDLISETEEMTPAKFPVSKIEEEHLDFNAFPPKSVLIAGTDSCDSSSDGCCASGATDSCGTAGDSSGGDGGGSKSTSSSWSTDASG